MQLNSIADGAEAGWFRSENKSAAAEAAALLD
jgi:hypothetical protein